MSLDSVEILGNRESSVALGECMSAVCIRCQQLQSNYIRTGLI